MKTKLTILLAGLLLNVQAQTNYPIVVPFWGAYGTRTNFAGWWDTNSPYFSTNNQASVTNWQVVQAEDANFIEAFRELAAHQGQLSDLPEFATNSMVNSFKVVVWRTNWLSVPWGATNVLPFTVTNFGGVDWSPGMTMLFGMPSQIGNPAVLTSTNGTNWAASTAPRLGRVWVAFKPNLAAGSVDGAPAMLPLDAAVSNIVIYGLSNTNHFGVTNAFHGQSLEGDDPRYPSEFATKRYVDSAFSTTAWWDAKNDVQLNGFGLHLSPDWELLTATNATGDEQVQVQWGSIPALTITQPRPTYAGSNSLSVSVENLTNVTVFVRTNGVTSAPLLYFSHLLAPLNWSFVAASSSWPAATNGAYVLNFSAGFLDQGYMEVGFASTNRVRMDLAGLVVCDGAGITNLPKTLDINLSATGIVGTDTNAVFTLYTNIISPGTLSRSGNALRLSGGGYLATGSGKREFIVSVAGQTIYDSGIFKTAYFPNVPGNGNGWWLESWLVRTGDSTLKCLTKLSPSITGASTSYFGDPPYQTNVCYWANLTVGFQTNIPLSVIATRVDCASGDATSEIWKLVWEP